MTTTSRLLGPDRQEPVPHGARRAAHRPCPRRSGKRAAMSRPNPPGAPCERGARSEDGLRQTWFGQHRTALGPGRSDRAGRAVHPRSLRRGHPHAGRL